MRIVRDGRYAKLSDLLPKGLNSKKLHNRLGNLKRYKDEKLKRQERFNRKRTRDRDREFERE